MTKKCGKFNLREFWGCEFLCNMKMYENQQYLLIILFHNLTASIALALQVASVLPTCKQLKI